MTDKKREEMIDQGAPRVVEVEETWEWDRYSDRPAGCFFTGMKGGCFHKCLPDPKESNIIQYHDINDRSCWQRIPQLCIRLNPIATTVSIIVIWGFVGWCMYDPDEAAEIFTEWKVEITRKFTWLYVGSQDLWAVFMIMLYCSKYGKVKMGKDDDEPEYSSATWFTMLFACGIGVGLTFYGVAEPMFHYAYANRYFADAHMPDNELAQWAINLSFFHWGIHGWIVYCIMGMCMGIVSYRLGLPMTVKSCFYPLIGDKIYGWIGDFIDITSIITTLFGVCTSLGLGVIQLNEGLALLDDRITRGINTQIIIIWCITAIATVSTLSGIGLGIRRLSEVCFSVGVVIMLLVLFLTNTWYILNLFVQSIGFYIQWIIQLGFHCDAFEQLGPSYGGTDRGRALPDGVSDGPEGWMNGWTIFYWGWWISWSPFVGMFVAKVSKGRTLREFIHGTMTAPILYSFIWFSIFGGAGIKMEREAFQAGLCCNHNFLNGSMLNSTDAIGMIPIITHPSYNQLCDGDCNRCSMSILNLEETVYDNVDTSLFVEHLGVDSYGIQLPDKSLARLSCRASERMWFDMMQSFGGLGKFMHVFSIIALILYFVTSSDSGSYVIDCIAANGDNEPPRIQRAFWAFTEGAAATALLKAGGSDALVALQTVSVACGLPYTFFLCFICISLWRALAVDAGDLDPYGPQFAVGMLDVFARPTARGVGLVLLNVFTAPYSYAKAIVHTSDSSNSKGWTIFYTVALYIFYFGAIACFAISKVGILDELWAMGWVLYLAFSCAGGAARIGIRNKYGINGNGIEDLFTGILLYPVLGYQLSETVDERVERGTDINTGYGPRDEHKHFEMSVAVGQANPAYPQAVGQANPAYPQTGCQANPSYPQRDSPPPQYGVNGGYYADNPLNGAYHRNGTHSANVPYQDDTVLTEKL